MIVVIEAVLAEIADVHIRPAVVIVIADGDAEAPAVVGYAGLCGHVRECAIVIVVKQRGMRWRGFARHRIVS